MILTYCNIFNIKYNKKISSTTTSLTIQKENLEFSDGQS